MISSQRKNQTTMTCMFVDLSTEMLGDCTDGKRVEHIPVRRVRGRNDGAIGVNGIVVVELVPELLRELSQEAGRNESGWSGINAWLALRAGGEHLV